MSAIGVAVLTDHLSSLAKEKDRAEAQITSLKTEIEQLEAVLDSKQAELAQTTSNLAEQEDILAGYEALISQATANASQIGSLSLELSVILRNELKRVSA